MFETMELPVRRGNVPLRVVKGHFATNHSHINYYIDVTKQKVRLNEAEGRQARGNLKRLPLRDRKGAPPVAEEATAAVGQALVFVQVKRSANT